MTKYLYHIIFLCVGFLLGNFSQLIYHQTQDWNNYWQKQREVVVGIDFTNKTVLAKEAGESAKPIKPKQESVIYKNWDDIMTIYAKLRKMESSNGTAGIALKCKAKGDTWINEIGWSPSTGFCFVDEPQQLRGFASWINAHRNDEKMTMASALCHYNLGGEHGKYSTCDYYYKYLDIKI